MNYQFDDKEAELYGVDEAIMINNLRFWILHNRANAKHFYDGRWWTFNSLSAFTRIFKFWTRRQVERVIGSLLQQEVIVKGEYNKVEYDRTGWYAFKDEKKFLTKTPCHETVKTRHQTVTTHNETVTTIPDSKTDTNTDILDSTYGEGEKIDLETFFEQQKKGEVPPVAPPPPTSRKLTPKVYFKDSLFADLNYTKQFFSGSEYGICDFDYYHAKVTEWATLKGGKTKKRDELGWRDTFQNWIFKDSNNGVLRTINNKLGHAINKPTTHGKQPSSESWESIQARYAD